MSLPKSGREFTAEELSYWKRLRTGEDVPPAFLYEEGFKAGEIHMLRALLNEYYFRSPEQKMPNWFKECAEGLIENKKKDQIQTDLTEEEFDKFWENY